MKVPDWIPYPWQREEFERLCTRYEAGRFPHALLIRGQPGLGKRHFAHCLGAMLLCRQPGADRTPCGKCAGCTQYAAGSHPDWHHVQPPEDKRNILKEQIHALSAFLGLTAAHGGTKLALIDPAEFMTRDSANALLKTLEEPSPGSVMILITDSAAMLPATIRSRCQNTTLSLPRPEVAVAWLHDAGVEQSSAEQLLALAGGAPVGALQLAQHGGLQERDAVLDDLLSLAEGRGNPIAVADRWRGVGAERCARMVASIVLEALRVRLVGESDRARARAGVVEPQMLALAACLGPERLHAVSDAAVELRRRVQGRSNLNEALMLEAITMATMNATMNATTNVTTNAARPLR